MQRARPLPWSTLSIAGLGLALIGALVTGVLTLTLSRGYETSAPLFLAPIFIVVSLPALVAQARREDSATLLWLLVAALVLKLAGAVVRDYVALDIYGGGGDATGYHAEGVRLSEAFRTGNFDTGLDNLRSTNFIRFFTGVVYSVIGTSRLGGFLFYSWLGFWGLFFFYRAFTVSVPEGRPRTYARMVFFLPSLLFWPSSIGKEAWMMFALGIAAYGAARVFSGSTVRGIAVAAVGLWLCAIVRPHIAGMMAVALAAAYVFRRPREELRHLAPLVKVLSLAVLTVVALLIVSRAERFLEESGIDTAGGVTSAISDVGERTGQGGSEFEPSPVLGSPLRAPIGIVTVLFRPFAFEANSTASLLAALEGTFLVLLLLARWRWLIAALRSGRRQPYVVFAIVYAALFVVGFSGVANFGLLTRQRVQLLPVYLVLFSIPVRKEAEAGGGLDRSILESHGGSDSRPRVRPAVTPPSRRHDMEVDERLREELQAKIQGIEDALGRAEGREKPR